MNVLTLDSVTKHFGPEPVLAGVSLEVHPKERIGLVGPNGAGKTTLMKIIAGQESADSGKVELHPSCRLSFLEQQPSFPPQRTVWDEALAACGELTQLAQQADQTGQAIAAAQDEAERKRLEKQFDRLQHELQQRDAYNIDHQIERILGGLGFTPASYQQPAATLSGGQQNRLLLATLLLSAPDLMLLDEPSNHLDIEATQWLEQFLSESAQAMIIVSHDRYFLDRVTNRTFELFHGTIDAYTGNFSAYWRQKAERVEVERRTYERQQDEIAKTEEFIRKNFYGQKATQAEDRRKKLARIERVQPPREIVGPAMSFPPCKRAGDIVLRAEGVSKGYDRPLFKELSFQIERGERWGIIGPNGTGKTTLLRCLVGQETLDAGRATVGSQVKIGYFDQLLRTVDDELPVVEAVRPDHKEFNEPQRRDLLARFGITGEMVFQKVSSLSGGERNRTALARLSGMDVNFLVLDEPTNHLDLWARDSLERALAKFDGTLLFVSHDRYFLNRVADHLLVVEPHRFRTIEGNYESYLQFVQATGTAPPEANGKKGGSAAATSPSAKPKSKPADDASAAAKRKRKFPYRKVPDIERDILQRETRLAELNALLILPETHRSGDRIRQVQTDIAEAQQALAALYEHWEEAAELN